MYILAYIQEALRDKDYQGVQEREQPGG
jgi:hypothetical protein